MPKFSKNFENFTKKNFKFFEIFWKISKSQKFRLFDWKKNFSQENNIFWLKKLIATFFGKKSKKFHFLENLAKNVQNFGQKCPYLDKFSIFFDKSFLFDTCFKCLSFTIPCCRDEIISSVIFRKNWFWPYLVKNFNG